MPEEDQQQQATALPGWIAGLPDDLKANETFTKFKTVGEFAKDDLELRNKYSEAEKKLSNSIPKLPDDASDEDRTLFYEALGRPKQPSEYEFEGEDKNAPEWSNQWKQEFHSLGLTKPQAKALSQKWNTAVQKIVDTHNAKLQSEIQTATAALKSEWGNKFETNVELAKRLYQKHIGNELDKDFDASTEKTRLSMLRFIVKMAALTGEDRSPQGGLPNGQGKLNAPFIDYSKSPAPPR
jgi:hypothetical protein